MKIELQEGSFRDPSGFVFKKDGKLLRQINNCYKNDYNLLISSGLFEELVADGLLVEHKELKVQSNLMTKDCFKVIEPQLIEFISYPYEWAFGQLKSAALATLEIHRRAIAKGMVLKDASTYNIQFRNGAPVMIDTLSFEKYNEGDPWIAYKQFCQHFLAPLSLMAHTDVELSKLLRIYIDGIPLPLASKLLPLRTKTNAGLLTHVHWHAKSQLKHAQDGKKKNTKKTALISKNAMLGLLTSLANTTKALNWKQAGTEWGDYYLFTNYSDKAFETKKKIVRQFIEETKPNSVWDIGANDGTFSRLAGDKDIPTVAFDVDPIAVEKNYRQVVQNKEKRILPLVMDLTNPSPSLGWASEERASLVKRGPVDLILSLALIHHLAISNNLPLPKIADFFASLCKYLIIEFVPKGDSQVNILLATRKDIFPFYSEQGFEKAFKTRFKVVSKKKVAGSKRTLYLLKKS
jgi:hypothetical protein